MLIGDAESSLRIEVLERIPADVQCAGDTRFAVEVQTGGFHGRNKGVWIGAGELRRFLQDLLRLDSERTGRAEMVSLSPDDFRLAIVVVSPSGQIAAEGHVGRLYRGIRSWLKGRIEFSIDLDPTILRNLRNQLAMDLKATS